MLSISTGLPALPPATLPSPTNSKLPPATLPSPTNSKLLSGQSQPSIGLPARESSERSWRRAVSSRSPSPQQEVQAVVPVHAAPVRRARSPSPLQLVAPTAVQRSQSPQRVRIRSPQPALPGSAKAPCREQGGEDVCSASTPSLRTFAEQKKLPPPPQLLQAVSGSGTEPGSILQPGITKGVSQVTWGNTSNGLSASKAGLLQAGLAPTAISVSGGGGASWAFPGGPAAASEAAVRQLRREVEDLRTELRQVKAALQDGEQRKEHDELQGSVICKSNVTPEGDCKPDTNGHATGTSSEKAAPHEHESAFPAKLRAASVSDPHPLMQVEPFSLPPCFSMPSMAPTGDTSASAQAELITFAPPQLVSNSGTTPGLEEGCSDAIKRGSGISSEVRVDKEMHNQHCPPLQASSDRNVDQKLHDGPCPEVQSNKDNSTEQRPSSESEDDPQILSSPPLPASAGTGAAETASSKGIDQLSLAKGSRMCGSICVDDELCNSLCDDASVSLADASQGQCPPTLSALSMLGRSHLPEVSEGAQAGTGSPGSHWHQYHSDVQDECSTGFRDMPDVETGASYEGLSMTFASFNGNTGDKGGSESHCDVQTCREVASIKNDACEIFGVKGCTAAADIKKHEVQPISFGLGQRVDANDELGGIMATTDAKDSNQREVASPAWGATSPCRLTEASPSPTEDDLLSPDKDGSGSYILVSPTLCDRSYIIAEGQDEGKTQPPGISLFSPLRIQGDSSPTLSPSQSIRSIPECPSDMLGKHNFGALQGPADQGPAAVAAAVLAATSRQGPSHTEAGKAPSAMQMPRLPAAPVSISLAASQLMAGMRAEAGLDLWDSQDLDSARSGFSPKVAGDPWSLDSRSFRASASASLAASLSESQSSFQTLMPLPLPPPPPVPCFGLKATPLQSSRESDILSGQCRSGVSRAASCSSSTSSHRRYGTPPASSTGPLQTHTPAGSGERRSALSQPPASKYFTAPPPRESFCLPPELPSESPTCPGQFDAPSESHGSAFSSRVGSLAAPIAVPPSTPSADNTEFEADTERCKTECVAQFKPALVHTLPQVPSRYSFSGCPGAGEFSSTGVLLRGSSFRASTPSSVVTLPAAPARALSPGPSRSSRQSAPAPHTTSGVQTPPRNVWAAPTAATAMPSAEVVSRPNISADLRHASMAPSVSPKRDAKIASFCATPNRPSSSILSRQYPSGASAGTACPIGGV